MIKLNEKYDITDQINDQAELILFLLQIGEREGWKE